MGDSVVKTSTMSFASVAAMAPPGADNVQAKATDTKAVTAPAVQATKDDGVSKGIQHAFNKLDVKEFSSSIPDVSEHVVHPAMTLRSKLDDEKTHLSTYSIAAHSLDGKSVASAATFGLDEKESLRPDDSASAKATEDDDSNSGPASGDPNSRVGSEAGAKAFRDQFNEISDRIPAGFSKQPPWARRPGQGAVEELRRSALSSPSSANMATPGTSSADAQQANSVFAYKYLEQPDEKLLEAMESPKDRLFLLQLEQQVISFIQDSNEQLLSLPPCNSFYRLLAHRLGDYYALSHFVDNSVSHVKLFRTPFCQLRTPLSEIAQKLAGPVDSRPILPSMKIMRRTGANGEEQATGSGATTTEPSVGPSNTGSEAGDESTKLSGVASPTDSNGAKEKPALSSREEREAKYKEARERIFADYKESTKSDSNADEGSAETQPQSTTPGKKKKRSKHADDNFDSRSSYNLYYPAAYRAGQMYEPDPLPMVNYNGYMQPVNTQTYQNMYQQPYPHYPPTSIPPQIPGYHMPPPGGPMMASNAMYQQTPPQLSSFGPPMLAPYYNGYSHPPQMTGPPVSYPSPAPSNHSTPSSRPQSQMSDQSWGQGGLSGQYGQYQGGQPYYAPQQQQMLQGGVNAPNLPYAYGQLPCQPPGNGSRTAHPLPGSYARQNFNPHSRVFIPGQFDGSENQGDCYQTTFPASFSSSPQQQYSAVDAQASHMSPMQGLSNSNRGGSPRKPSNNSFKSQPPAQSSLSKWGTPANLPPKPPPPATTMDEKSTNKD